VDGTPDTTRRQTGSRIGASMIALAIVLAVVLYLAKLIVTNEYPRWAARLAELGVAIAARLEPEECRASRREEWHAELEATQHVDGVAGIGFSVQLIIAASRDRLATTVSRVRKVRHSGTTGQRLRYGLDFTAAVAGLVFLAPVMVGVALAVRLSSRGPAIVRQRRIGRHGQPFAADTFRSVAIDVDGGARRPTRVGRTLHALSLTELPGLWNVVRGQTGLVWQVPPLRGHSAHVKDYCLQMTRLVVTTPGFASVAGDRGESLEDLTRELTGDGIEARLVSQTVESPGRGVTFGEVVVIYIAGHVLDALSNEAFAFLVKGVLDKTRRWAAARFRKRASLPRPSPIIVEFRRTDGSLIGDVRVEKTATDDVKVTVTDADRANDDWPRRPLQPLTWLDEEDPAPADAQDP
jgi:lipopolysaccharide/colanic/teichoic acid biosynthesis glycosyltransferase